MQSTLINRRIAMKNFCRCLLLLFVVTYLTPAQNYSLTFDGTSYVSIPHSNSLNLSNQLTIECWFTVHGASTNDWIGIVSKAESSAVSYSGYFLALGQTGPYPNAIAFLIYPSGDNMISSFSATLDHWYNLTVTYNGSTMMLFLDGNLIQQKAATGLIADNTFPLTIGGQNGNFWNRNLNGKIDEVRISSVARYGSNFVPKTHFDSDTDTRALYHFNEGAGNTVFDSSGHNNNGTIHDATWSLVTSVREEEALNIPDECMLGQNYPNPFNPTTTIRFGLPTRSQVTLTVYNTLGQQVAALVQGEKEGGYHEVKFDGTGLSSGVYFYRITAGDYVATKQLLLLR